MTFCCLQKNGRRNHKKGDDGKDKNMRVALINEFSQAGKNSLIYEAVKKSADRYHVTIYNTGMKKEGDVPCLNYMHLGIQAFILLNTGVVEFVITGCGSGQGACMSLNSYPGVTCGYITDASDAYLFTQINNGNAIALSFAKDFGWAAELKIESVCDKIFSGERGCGYPCEMKEIQNKNSQLFREVKTVVAKEPVEILKSLDQDMILTAIAGEEFRNCFLEKHDKSELSNFIMELLKGGDKKNET